MPVYIFIVILFHNLMYNFKYFLNILFNYVVQFYSLIGMISWCYIVSGHFPDFIASAIRSEGSRLPSRDHVCYTRQDVRAAATEATWREYAHPDLVGDLGSTHTRQRRPPVKCCDLNFNPRSRDLESRD